MDQDTREYAVVTAFRRVELDGREAWEGQCLDYGLVVYGETLELAMRHLKELMVDVAIEDLCEGRNPLDRRAPEAELQELRRFIEHQQPQAVPVEDLQRDVGAFRTLVTPFHLRCVRKDQQGGEPCFVANTADYKPMAA